MLKYRKVGTMVLNDNLNDDIKKKYDEIHKPSIKFNFTDYDKSIGHIIYLHLGGEDQVSNLEIVDTEVLWSLQIEIANRINEIKKIILKKIDRTGSFRSHN